MKCTKYQRRLYSFFIVEKIVLDPSVCLKVISLDWVREGGIH
jgi:hypothetical protein